MTLRNISGLINYLICQGDIDFSGLEDFFYEIISPNDNYICLRSYQLETFCDSLSFLGVPVDRHEYYDYGSSPDELSFYFHERFFFDALVSLNYKVYKVCYKLIPDSCSDLGFDYEYERVVLFDYNNSSAEDENKNEVK